MNTSHPLSVWNNSFGPRRGLLREVDQIFDDLWSMSQSAIGQNSDAVWHPACDLEETNDHYLLTLEMPGIPKDQIKLEVVDNQILISGERRQEQTKKEGVSWYSERRFGKFHRSFKLPPEAQSDKIEANYQDGVLRVYLPKAASAQPRQIKITNGAGTTGFFDKLLGQTNRGVASDEVA